jgi:hypothetical protein
MQNMSDDISVQRDYWDSGTERAKALRSELFGTPEEVAEMARMERTARSREEARKLLREIAARGPLTGRANITATLSNNSIEEILNGEAVKKSIDKYAHFLAAANVDKLFSNAIEPFTFELNPEKHNENIQSIRRLYSPMTYNEKIVPVKFTVKELKQKKEGRRLYSLEAIDIDLKQNKEGAGTLAPGVSENPDALSNPSLAQSSVDTPSSGTNVPPNPKPVNISSPRHGGKR